MNTPAISPANRTLPSVSMVQTKRLLRMLYCLIAALLLYAWGPPLRSVISAVIWPSVDYVQRDADSFLALCFDDDSFARGEDPAEVLADHIRALENAGYSPLRLKDARRLIQEDKPVSAKAVLLTFDFNNLSRYHGLESVLRKAGWYGTAFFSTGSGENERSDARMIATMARSRFWEIGARSHQGYERVPDPNLNRFVRSLSSFRWLTEAGRYETLEEFSRRVHKDHQQSLAVFRDRLNLRPQAYAYPFGDYGQLDDGIEEIRQVNQLEVARHYEIAFTRGELALNNRGTDPLRLNRLYVQPDWNGRLLVRRLNADRPRSPGSSNGVGVASSIGAWMPETGHVAIEHGIAQVRTDNRGREATAWYASPVLGGEFNASMDFTWQGGDFVVYFKRTETPSTYSRIRFSTNDVAVLEQKAALQVPQVVEEGRAKYHRDRLNTLELFLRSNRVYARFNGESIFGHGVELSDLQTRSRFGVGLVPAPETVGKASIHVVSVREALPRMVTWDDTKVTEDQAVDWLHENAGRLTHISPPTDMALARGTRMSEVFQSVKMLANVYHMQFVPRIDVPTPERFEALDGLVLADMIASRDVDGLYVDMSPLNDLGVSHLQAWLASCSRQLDQVDADLYLLLPPSLENLDSVKQNIREMPRIYLVSKRLKEEGGDPGKTVRIETISAHAPRGEAARSSQELLMLEQPAALSSDELEQRIRNLQAQSARAIELGEHEKAIVWLSEWHELSPSDSRPVTMIADALYALDYMNESLDFYRQSLDLNPGQVKLVARLTEIFSYMQRDEEARNLLNLYVRLFPEDPDILYAQALWLVDQERPREAQQRLDMILDRRPLDFQALMLKLRISDKPEDRMQALQRLDQLVEDDTRHLKLVDAIQKYDLLTLQNSHIIVDILKKIERVNPDPKLMDRIQRTLPRHQTVVENLTDGQLSGSWEIEGGKVTGALDGVQLLSLPSQAQAQLKLLRAQRMHDSYIEGTFKNVRDSVWLYGRRSIDNLVRFGIEADTGKIFLQVWKEKNTRIHAGFSDTIEDLPDEIQLRMEIRGNGVIGYLNGKRVVTVPLELTKEVSHGWMAVSVISADRGQARATITSLEAGPLPVHMALLPQTPSTNEADLELQQIRSLLGRVTDASPDWFKIDAESKWGSEVDPTDDFFRLFSRYYRIRLVPTVQVDADAVVDIEEVRKMIKMHQVDGVVLRFAAPPGSAWLRESQETLVGQKEFIYVVSDSSIEGQAQVQGLGRAALLFNNDGAAVDVKMRPSPDYVADVSAGELKNKAVLITVSE